jgi:hypothetical protein
MSDQLWTVTHATAEGQLRWWTIPDYQAEVLLDILGDSECLERNGPWVFDTTSGRAMIWLTPGQSLTVERAR